MKPILSKVIFGALVLGFVAYLAYRNTPIPPTPKPEVTRVRNLDKIWGDPAKTMFPAVNSPKYISDIKKVTFLKDTDEVFFVKHNNGVYVYPAMIIGFHHLVNDTIDGKDVLISVCLLSDSAVEYSRTVADTSLKFGVLGPLYYGNLVMYDEESDSYWLQMTGEGVKGKHSGDNLKYVAAITKSTWGTIKKLPSLYVLQPEREEAFYREWYGRMKVSEVGLNSLKSKGGIPDTRRELFERGIGILVDDKALYVPISEVEKSGGIKKSVGAEEVTISIDATTKSPIVSTSSGNYRWTTTYWYSWAAFFPDTGV